jgi:two-component system nitrate/nitrite response regulator NarL
MVDPAQDDSPHPSLLHAPAQAPPDVATIGEPHAAPQDGRVGVYVAEDHPVFREAVAGAIRAWPGLELLGAAAGGPDALAAIRDLRPAVAILDQSLPQLSGTEVLRAIVSEGLPTRVVMLSADGSSALVYEAMKLGGAAFLTKASTLSDICDAVVAVARGVTVIAPEVQSGLVDELRGQAGPARPVLTDRELQILRLIAGGLQGQQIAEQLFISASTVKTHVKSVLEKLGVHDRAAAVAEAMRRGLIS